MTEPDPFAAARAREEETSREYGQFVALDAIDIGTARAFNAGDPVPASHVERGVVSKDSVARTSTKAAAAVTSEKG